LGGGWAEGEDEHDRAHHGCGKFWAVVIGAFGAMWDQ
jgi:hypothetical protein